MSSSTSSGHRCHIHRDPAGEADALVTFLAEGLDRGAQCRVIAYTEAPDRAIGGLAAAGIDIADALLRDALDVLPATGTPLLEMPFVPQRAIDYIRDLTQRGVASSFPELRLAIEMRWALASAVGEAGLAAFERGLDALTKELPVVAFCQYDAGAFPPDLLQRAARLHGVIVE